MKFSILFFAVLLANGVLFAQDKDSKVFYAGGPANVREVALTFDDGPGPNTDKVLALLDKYNIKATFFMEGQLVAMRHDIVKRVTQKGHEIGGHSWSHPDFYHYKGQDYREKLQKEIDMTQNAFKALGMKPKLMRMPYGYVKDWVKEIARQNGLILINWGFGCDWTNKSKEEIADAYVKHIGPGMIFLMHDGGSKREKTLYTLPILIEELKKKGYKFVTISEMLGFDQGDKK
jgi:chitin deacetylase